MIARIIFLVAVLVSTEVQAQNTWTLENVNPGGQLLWSVADGNAGMVAVGNNGRILSAPDGVNWVPRASPSSGWLVAVTYGNGRYVVVGESGTILVSTDAITWTFASVPGTTARLNGVTYAQGKYVAVGEGGTIVVSTDANTWNSVNSGTSNWLHGLVFASGKWVTTGQAGTILTSTDALSWTNRSISNFTRNIESVTFSESYSSTFGSGNAATNYVYTNFVAVGDQATVLGLYFTDITYTSGAAPYFNFGYGITTGVGGVNVALRSISSWNKVFVVAGDNGVLLTSRSASGPWTRVNLGTSRLLNATGFGRSSLILVGADETIYQSEPIFPSKLGNVSTRGEAGTGANVMIAGTVITGTVPKQFLIRGVGPELASRFGMTGTLADPVLTIFNGAGSPVASNSRWGANLNPANISSAAAAVGAFPLTEGSRDAALLITLSPGLYTFQLGSVSNTPGIGLIEAYDLDAITSTSSRAINLSTRGRVGTDAKILIAGLVIQGPSARTVLFRGIGPALASTFNLSDTLADPRLTLFASDGTAVASNDNWSTTTTVLGRDITADELRTAMAVCGAFPLADGSKDAALLVTLAPGAYTIHLTGVDNGTGIALVEAYEVPSN